MPEAPEMQKRTLILPDGRYLIFYTFEPAGSRRPQEGNKSTKTDKPASPPKP